MNRYALFVNKPSDVIATGACVLDLEAEINKQIQAGCEPNLYDSLRKKFIPCKELANVLAAARDNLTHNGKKAAKRTQQIAYRQTLRDVGAKITRATLLAAARR